MTRLIDKAMREKRWGAPAWLAGRAAEAQQMMALMAYFMPTAEVIVADNVAEYLYAETDQENWDKSDFPCVAPPFENFWVEWRKPSRVISEKIGLQKSEDIVPDEVGWLFLAKDIDDGWCYRGMPLYIWPTMALGGNSLFWPAVNVDIEVNKDGTIRDWTSWAIAPDKGTSEDLQRVLPEWATAISTMTHVVFLTLSFMNCKNVDVVEQAPPPKLSKKHERKKGAPLRHYKTLRIDPMRKILRTEGQSQSEGLARALHVCRGHFNTYTQERPLFGKHVGTWWWGPQLRGTADAGEIVKRYDVTAAKS